MNKLKGTGSSSFSLSISNKPIQPFALSRQKGIGLIEVMIGVLIFVGGVMAVAGMQSQAIRVTHDSLQRSQAVWLANATAELMKLNPAGLESSGYQTAATTASADIAAYCPVIPTQCIGTACTPGQMAAFDVHDLMCRNANDIINPTIVINCPAPCASGAVVTITIAWDSRGAEQGVLAVRQQVGFTYNRN